MVKKIITNNIQIFQTSDIINQVTSYTNMTIGDKHSLSKCTKINVGILQGVPRHYFVPYNNYNRY